MITCLLSDPFDPCYKSTKLKLLHLLKIDPFHISTVLQYTVNFASCKLVLAALLMDIIVLVNLETNFKAIYLFLLWVTIHIGICVQSHF